jgi:hypothetical protein
MGAAQIRLDGTMRKEVKMPAAMSMVLIDFDTNNEMASAIIGFLH